jgi:hydroxymethylbilane synthase
MSEVLKIGTRASVMAVRQSEGVIQALQEKFPDHKFEMVTRPADADRDLKSRGRVGRRTFTSGRSQNGA